MVKRRSAFAAAVLTAVVLLFAALNPEPSRPPPPAADQQRAIFDQLVKEEPTSWQKARDDWAQHRWSQQDSFGAFERGYVDSTARQLGRWPQDLFGVIDEGMRRHWPGPDGRPLQSTVVPLKTRPMD